MEMNADPVSATPQLIPVNAFDLVVFGAAGDLALRKLVPSLFHRFRDGQIPDQSKIIGSSRAEMTDDEYRNLAKESFKKFHPKEDLNEDEYELGHFVVFRYNTRMKDCHILTSHNLLR